MKHLTILNFFAFVFLLTSCKSDHTQSSTVLETSKVLSIKDSVSVDANSNTEVSGSIEKGELLMKSSDCYSCHLADAKLIGPSFSEIALKYPKNKENIDLLVGKIINGGSGAWGEIPMQAHAQLDKDEIAVMVDFILSTSLNK
jgi:cytochrome c